MVRSTLRYKPFRASVRPLQRLKHFSLVPLLGEKKNIVRAGTDPQLGTDDGDLPKPDLEAANCKSHYFVDPAHHRC